MSKRKELTENGTKEAEQVEQTHTDDPQRETDILRQQQIFSEASLKENSIEKQKDSIARQDEGESGDLQATPSREELVQHVYARAWKDDAFCQAFQANPEAVLEQEYAEWLPGGKFPSELSIKVVEEEKQTICFVLPPRVPNHLPEVDDLKEEELLEATGEIFTGGCTRNCTGDCTGGCTGGCSGTHCVLYGNNLLRGPRK
jgi:hypothetical protein